MTYDPLKHHRRSIRLKGYDYGGAGAYFVTVVTRGRACVLGETAGDEMRLSPWGQIAAACWLDLPRSFARVTLDVGVVMPNHLHGIVMINDNQHASRKGEAFDPQAPATPAARGPIASPLRSARMPRGTQPGSLAAIVQNFKAVSARKINQATAGGKRFAWQRGYYEHIIRDVAELDRIRRYIESNPLSWALDEENPERSGPR